MDVETRTSLLPTEIRIPNCPAGIYYSILVRWNIAPLIPNLDAG